MFQHPGLLGPVAILAALVVAGCGKEQEVVLVHYEHEDPVVAYLMNWQPERNYRPGFAAEGAQTEPSLRQVVAFYGDLARVKDLALEGRHREAGRMLRRMQDADLPLEDDNIRRLLAIIDRHLQETEQ
jgi:hypothetical protein